jgi:hypothetical protein
MNKMISKILKSIKMILNCHLTKLLMMNLLAKKTKLTEIRFKRKDLQLLNKEATLAVAEAAADVPVAAVAAEAVHTAAEAVDVLVAEEVAVAEVILAVAAVVDVLLVAAVAVMLHAIKMIVIKAKAGIDILSKIVQEAAATLIEVVTIEADLTEVVMIVAVILTTEVAVKIETDIKIEIDVQEETLVAAVGMISHGSDVGMMKISSHLENFSA